MADYELFGMYLGIGVLVGILMVGLIHQCPEQPLQSQGYEAVLSFGNGLTLYFEGEEVTVERWQELLEVKQDGKVGYKTLQKAIMLNRTDVRSLK